MDFVAYSSYFLNIFLIIVTIKGSVLKSMYKRE